MVIEVFTCIFTAFISGIGWGVGKRFKLDSKDIAALLVYVISPFVIFTPLLSHQPTGAI